MAAAPDGEGKHEHHNSSQHKPEEYEKHSIGEEVYAEFSVPFFISFSPSSLMKLITHGVERCDNYWGWA